MLEVGQVCLKTAGREAGRYCVIVDVVDKDFVMVTGPKNITKVKRRKCNVTHLEPVPIKIEIAKNASDEDVKKAYEKADVINKVKTATPEPKRAEPKAESVEAAAEEKPKKKAKPKKEEVAPAEAAAEKPADVVAEKPKRARKKKTEEPAAQEAPAA
jgi:large subunit ribosomal protein L14e